MLVSILSSFDYGKYIEYTISMYESQKKWRKNNPEKYKLLIKNWKERNKEKVRQYSYNQYLRNKNDPEKVKRKKIIKNLWIEKNRNNLTLKNRIYKENRNVVKVGKDFYIDREEHNKIIKSSSVCEICGGINKSKRLFIDHCHKTNKLRGLLCITCNSGLGFFKDNDLIMKNAIDYLIKYK